MVSIQTIMEGAETAEAALRRRTEELGRRLAALAARGVVIHDPRQTYIADDVQLERISPARSSPQALASAVRGSSSARARSSAARAL
ncbi:MAG: hypothetical protein IPK80_00200 [Nannocystis sp.]|nr:hypothetical protein [Nannocystis sp.]